LFGALNAATIGSTSYRIHWGDIVITRRVVSASASLALGAGLLLAATPVVNAADAAPQVDDCIQVNDDILWEADAPVSIVECTDKPRD
jgi:hypothetical protein